ncbi:hypothetical protein A2W24_04355 [Microgenomates group bacterium RBG_16_45_19]|nr:MAG: hypothetical protein A2W24_04355 [Microgenomates group bacterium RBG_16_45_19]
MNVDEVPKIGVIPEVSEPPPMDEPKASEPKLVSPKPAMSQKTKTKKPWIPTIVLTAVVILAGVGTGYALFQLKPATALTGGEMLRPGDNKANAIQAGKTYGAEDASQFPDTTEGILVKGGIDGEGSHHLMRTGGPSRNVYLTSSVLDLDQFINHQVEVKGETFNAQKAGWLMDVGQVKVVSLNAEKPFTEEVEIEADAE